MRSSVVITSMRASECMVNSLCAQLQSDLVSSPVPPGDYPWDQIRLGIYPSYIEGCQLPSLAVFLTPQSGQGPYEYINIHLYSGVRCVRPADSNPLLENFDPIMIIRCWRSLTT